jgi:hypothetical protein
MRPHRLRRAPLTSAATGVDPAWQAVFALMQVAYHRNDPVALRQRWEHAHRIVTANEPRGVQLWIELHRGLAPGAWDSTELIEHYDRLLPRPRRNGTATPLVAWVMTFALVLYGSGQPERSTRVLRVEVAPPTPRTCRRGSPWDAPPRCAFGGF